LCHDEVPKVTGKKAAIVTATLLMVAQSIVPSFSNELRAFAPAFYDPGQGRGDGPKLYVFPIESKSFAIALPFQLGKFAVSPDGTVLYGPRFFDLGGRNTGLYKTEISTSKATRIAGSEGLASIYGITASSAKIVVSAGFLTDAGLVSRCGLYELMLSTGAVHEILSNSDCKYASSWSSISLSPESEKIVAVRKHRLELIDTKTKTVRSLGDGFYDVAWSPDGRWIAALGDNGEHTVLFDAITFDKRRTLPSSEVIWSPNSHSIVASRVHSRCPPDFGTLHLIDIESGKTSLIQSSSCKINHLVFGWINVAVL
jgi:WD40 repeat protein